MVIYRNKQSAHLLKQ